MPHDIHIGSLEVKNQMCILLKRNNPGLITTAGNGCENLEFWNLHCGFEDVPIMWHTSAMKDHILGGASFLIKASIFLRVTKNNKFIYFEKIQGENWSLEAKLGRNLDSCIYCHEWETKQWKGLPGLQRMKAFPSNCTCYKQLP